MGTIHSNPCMWCHTSRTHSWSSPCNTGLDTRGSKCSRSRQSFCTGAHILCSCFHSGPGHSGMSVCTSCLSHRICCTCQSMLSRTAPTHSSIWQGLHMTSSSCWILSMWRTLRSYRRKCMYPLVYMCRSGMHSRTWHLLHSSTEGLLAWMYMMCKLLTRLGTHYKRHRI